MPVYLFTFHSYRSWNADNPRGYVRRGQGILAPSKVQSRCYDARATQLATTLAAEHQQVITWILHDACRRRDWRLHQVACETTHVHFIVSWSGSMPWQEVSNKLKNLMSWALGKHFNRVERNWFSGGGSRKRVRDRRHFDYLMEKYLPSHRGLCWREGDQPPAPPRLPPSAISTNHSLQRKQRRP